MAQTDNRIKLVGLKGHGQGLGRLEPALFHFPKKQSCAQEPKGQVPFQPFGQIIDMVLMKDHPVLIHFQGQGFHETGQVILILHGL